MISIIINNSKVLGKIKRASKINRLIKEIQIFFENKGNINCKINFIEKREEMDSLKGYKTPIWMSANADSKTKIITIFTKESFNKETNHPKEEFESTLKHELCHMFCSQNFNFREPCWLSEGLAGFISKQKFSKKMLDVTSMHTFDEWKKNGDYGSAFYFVSFLINKYGKHKVIQLIKSSDSLNKENFYIEFEKIFQSDIKEIIDEWIAKN